MYSIWTAWKLFRGFFDVYSVSMRIFYICKSEISQKGMGAVQKMEIPRETFSSSLGQDFPKLDPKFMAKKSCSWQNNRTHISQIEQTQQEVNWYEWERSTWPVAFFIEPDVPPNTFSVNQYQMIKFQTIRPEHSEIPGALWSTHASQNTAIMEKDWPTNSRSKQRPVLGLWKSSSTNPSNSL